MKWPSGVDDFALPVRDSVDVGQAAESAMRLGVSGIRTVEWMHNDGSVVRLSNRGGYPLFESVQDDGVGKNDPTYLRGFVAVVPGASTGTLFNPYTLAVVQHGFKPAGALYYVLDFKTPWNVSPSDTTNWADVIVFDGSKILINGLRMVPPLMDLPSVPSGAVPYFINTGREDTQYGTATEKRMFAVAREMVKTWAAGGTTETLTPTLPRTDEKALTTGQRIVRATHKAWLGQLYYSGPSATDNAGAWAFTQREVNMMLAAPFLSGSNSSTSVDMTTPGFTFGSPVSSTVTEAVPVEPTPLLIKAEDSFDEYYYGSREAHLYWVYTGVVLGEVQVEEFGSSLKTTWSGSASTTGVVAGSAFDYTCVNAKTIDVVTAGVRLPAQEIQLVETDDATWNASKTDVLYLPFQPGEYWSGGAVTPYRGRNNHIVNPYVLVPSGGNRTIEDQTVTATVALPGSIGNLIDVALSRKKSYGWGVNVTPNMTYYDSRIGTRAYVGDFGMGSTAKVESKLDPLYPVPPEQEAAALAKVTARVQEWKQQTYYEDSASGGVARFDYYNYSYSSDVTRNSRSLTWSSKDFILCDTANGVFISVEGEFVGSGHPATALLNVLIRIKTRHSENTIAIITRDYAYAELLPEMEVDTGKYAVPSPQIRAMFVPLHQEQGSFKGAHYVTLAEEGLGAAPAHLFNFRLLLHKLDDVGDINTLNLTDNQVHFIPFNLLEMLYCFVFSQDYGVGAITGHRYPVTFTARYNDLASNLFGVPFDIAIRDGVISNWTHSLHSSFVGVKGTSLHRV